MEMEFDLLVEQYEKMIHQIMKRLNVYKNKEEFYQTGLIALWEARERFDPELGDFAPYAYSYIRGRLMSLLTKTNKFETKEMYVDEEVWLTFPDPNLVEMNLNDDLKRICETLTPAQRKWLLYTVVSDLSVREIATLENVTVSAVKQWREGARRKLQRVLAEENELMIETIEG